MKQQKGFTLVELMVVIGIIGIMMAFAIPIYTDFIERAKVADAVSLLSGLKHTAVEFYYYHGHWPATVASVGSKTQGMYTSTITTGGSEPVFWVEATLKGQIAGDSIYGRQMRLYYDTQKLAWWCSVNGVGDDGDGGQPVPIYLVPGSCKD